MQRIADKVLNWGLPLLLFLLPFQTKYIFWQPELLGNTTPYGELALYGTHLLVALLFLTSLFYRRLNLDWLKKSFLVVLVLALVTGITGFSLENLAWLRLLIISLTIFNIIISSEVSSKKLIWAFVLGLLPSVILGTLQVVTGSSMASEILGLAVRNSATPGDSVWIFQGERMLRAYGFFPHPNIFAGYLVAGILLFARFAKTLIPKVIFTSLIMALLLTFSESAWLALVVGALLLLAVKNTKVQNYIKARGSSATLVLMLISLFALGQYFTGISAGEGSIGERALQWQNYNYITENIFFGIGPAEYATTWQTAIPGLDWWLYQPIHNVPLLVFAEVGLIGVLILLWFLYKIDQINYKELESRGAQATLATGASLLVIAMFDHYLWTLWPGLALAALVLAFAVRSAI